MDILNSPEYTDNIETLFPTQRVRLFSPKLTVSMFMAQALNGRPTCSTNTGAYCKARQRMALEKPPH
jgi:hypothetical protein